MSVNIEDRPLEVVREEVVDQLIMNYSHGELSYSAFEHRLDQAMECQSTVELKKLTEDLTLTIDKSYVESKKQEMGINFIAGETEEVEYIVDIFGGSTRSGAWKVAKEIRSVSIFGGSEIDFTYAQFSQPTLKIKMLNLFGGSTIYVPENINIITKTFSIFGGVTYKAPLNSQRNAPTIIFTGLSLFGGVDIKVKKPLKEQLVNFADNLKKMFS